MDADLFTHRKRALDSVGQQVPADPLSLCRLTDGKETYEGWDMGRRGRPLVSDGGTLSRSIERVLRV